jgi:hypothetical protein
MALPARCYDSLSEVYTVPKESFLRKYGTRIAGGLACAFVVSLVMHLSTVVEGIRWTGQIIRVVFGKPSMIKDPPRIPRIPLPRRIPTPKEIEEKIKAELAKRAPKGGETKPASAPPSAPKVIPKVIAPVVASIPKAAPIAAIVAAPKVVRKMEAIEKKIEKREEKLANAVHDGADAVRTGMNKIEKRLSERKEAKDRDKYDQLVVRAEKIKLKVDDNWSLARLEAEVNEAEDAAYRKRYNGQCPHCHHPVRIHRDVRSGPLICTYCNVIFSAWRARSLGPPPRPQPAGGWRLPF